MLVLFSACICLYGQELDYTIGNFTPDDINIKECAFDKDADAVVLHDLAMSNYSDSYQLVTRRKIKFKILKEKGIERANVKIRYYSDRDFEFISNIEAVILNVSEQGEMVKDKLSNKNIYKKQLNRLYSEVSFSLPNVKVGSIIEYSYTSTMKNYGGLSDWYFQTDMPVMLSSYILYILPNAEFAYTVYKSPLFPIEVKVDPKNGKAYYEMKNIPGLRDEVYMDAPRDYLQRVNFQFSGFTDYMGKHKVNTTWAQLAQDLSNEKMFGGQINKSLPNIGTVKTFSDGTTSAFAKMKFIHEYVRSNIVWNNIYSRYAENNIKEVWEKKKGNSAEINLLLLNLLKDAGLESYPLLVSERDNGKVDTTYPFLDQFNKVVAYVVIDGNQYILDGTDRQTPSHLIPFALLNTKGFIVDRKKKGFITIADTKSKNFSVIKINGKIEATGRLNGIANIYNYDYAKINKKEQYISGKSKYEEDFTKPYGDFKIDSFTVKGLDSDSLPMEHQFILNNDLNKSGAYLLLPYNFFTGYDKNPFISDNRFTNIDFGSRRSCVVKEEYTLPDNLQIESLPKKIKMTTPENSMSVYREVELKEKNVEINMIIEINKTIYTADEYDVVKEFYKRMFDLLNEPIVLKAK